LLPSHKHRAKQNGAVLQPLSSDRLHRTNRRASQLIPPALVAAQGHWPCIKRVAPHFVDTFAHACIVHRYTHDRTGPMEIDSKNPNSACSVRHPTSGRPSVIRWTLLRRHGASNEGRRIAKPSTATALGPRHSEAGMPAASMTIAFCSGYRSVPLGIPIIAV